MIIIKFRFLAVNLFKKEARFVQLLTYETVSRKKQR